MTNNVYGQDGAWISAHNLMSYKADTAPWLWEPFIRKGSLSAITGPSDCGKSTLMRQLAISVGNNDSRFMGFPLHVENREVCYISTEDEHSSTKEVLHKQFEGLNIAPQLTFKLLFDSERVLILLKEHLEKNKVGLVVIDAWADTFTGNPNNAIDVRQSLIPLRNLAMEYRCAIVLVHHNVKNSETVSPDKNKVNGSQAIEAKMRSVIDFRLGHKPDERHLTIVKGNSVAQEYKKKAFVLKLDSQHLLFENTESQISFETQKVKAKFDIGLWISRLIEYQEKEGSLTSAIHKIQEDFKEEGAPSKTWFMDNKSLYIPDDSKGGKSQGFSELLS